MTDDYVKAMKQNPQEHIYGIYDTGRYTRTLTDVVPLDIPIKAIGKLKLWNYNSQQK